MKLVSLWRHWWGRRKRLAPEQSRILRQLGEGWTLKSHRYLDGKKLYQLHSLTGEVEEVTGLGVEALMEMGYIYTNHKFPANSYLLTEKGRKSIS